MSRSISRESFNELKNYLGVYMQQGRVMLDSDWNESQDIAVSFLRRLTRETVGDGSPNTGFSISPVVPPRPTLQLSTLDTSGMDKGQAIGAIIGALIADLIGYALHLLFGPTMFFLSFPGALLEGFEELTGWQLSSAQGKLRIGRDRPYSGRGFLRLSGHAGVVTITRTLATLEDIAAHDMLLFRYRMSRQIPGTIKLFVEDDDGNRNVWLLGVPALAADAWLSSFAAPLDLSFRIVNIELFPAIAEDSYSADLTAMTATPPLSWTLTGAPGGMTIAAKGPDSLEAKLEWPNPVEGVHEFTVVVEDATAAEFARELSLTVEPAGTELDVLPLPDATTLLSQLRQHEIPTGTPADLTRIRKYGFEVYQNATTPIVWDFDDMRLGSRALERSMSENNFIIRGSAHAAFQNNATLLSVLASGFDEDDEEGEGEGEGEDEDDELLNVLALLNSNFELDQPSIENAGRLYIAGLPCVQIKDQLYASQADPNDAPLEPPPPGVVRTDEVYLDVWLDPVTYIQDPDIREIALGGPDTSTRTRVRHRVRVAQGGKTPRGSGIGHGTLATEGSYTARANRLYRIEIDGAGDLGTASFRWSDDNASTLARVIEPIVPGATRVVVEDASVFRPGDAILLSKEFGAERHRVQSIFGNVITLQNPAGAQLAALPAAARVADFTSFALDEHPMVQRWNAFGVPITIDPEDATISAAIPLGTDGVAVRFGGKAMRVGDYWTFRTRYLAGDEVSGIDPDTRIEELAFARAQGVEHHYMRLATIVRDGDHSDPDRIFSVTDRRPFAGTGGTISFTLANLTGLTGVGPVTHLGGFDLPTGSEGSKYVVFWQGDLFLTGTPSTSAKLRIQASFYDESATDPATEPDVGEVMSQDIAVPLRRKPKSVEVPLSLTFNATTDPCLCLPLMSVPSSIQLFVRLDGEQVDPFTVELVNQRVTVLELKRAY